MMHDSQSLKTSPAATPDADVIGSIWAAVLETTTCDRDANFFDLGGSSLKMMRIHAETQRQLGINVSIVEMFAYPTINSFAARLSELRTAVPGQFTVITAPSKPRPLARAFRTMKPRA